MTVLDEITRAMRDLGLLNASDVAGGDEAQIALDVFNDWIDALKIEALTIPFRTRTTWTIAANTQTYTVGTGSTVNVVRPALSDNFEVRFQDTSVSPTYERPLFRLTDQAWAAIPQKMQTSAYPIYVYYEIGAITGIFYLYYVPTATTLQGVLYSPTGITEPVTLTTVVSLPPGYRRFFRTNLAMEIAAAFTVSPAPTLAEAAMESKRIVKLANVRMSDLSIDAALVPRMGHGYSIVSDT